MVSHWESKVPIFSAFPIQSDFRLNTFVYLKKKTYSVWRYRNICVPDKCKEVSSRPARCGAEKIPYVKFMALPMFSLSNSNGIGLCGQTITISLDVEGRSWRAEIFCCCIRSTYTNLPSHRTSLSDSWQFSSIPHLQMWTRLLFSDQKYLGSPFLSFHHE